MSELLQNPMVMYAVALVIFLALAFKLGRKPITDWLDAEIAKIRADLDDAARLRAEAEAALADCKDKQAQAEAEAKVIVDMAKKQVEELRKQADADLAAMLVRHKQMAEEHIRMAKVEAEQHIREAALQMGMEIARQRLSEKLTSDEAAKIVDQALADVAAIKPVRIRA